MAKLIEVDSKEQSGYLKKRADAVGMIVYRADDTTMPLTADVRIRRDSPPEVLTGERKKWEDYMGSFFDKEERGRLDRQLACVDFGVIEGWPGEATGRWDAKSHMAATKHLWKLSFTMPIVLTANTEQTWGLYEYLRDTPNVAVRQNGIVKRQDSLLEATLKCLGVRPSRPLRAGGTMASETAAGFPGAALSAWVESWKDIAGVGPRTIEVAQKRLGPYLGGSA